MRILNPTRTYFTHHHNRYFPLPSHWNPLIYPLHFQFLRHFSRPCASLRAYIVTDMDGYGVDRAKINKIFYKGFTGLKSTKIFYKGVVLNKGVGFGVFSRDQSFPEAFQLNPYQVSRKRFYEKNALCQDLRRGDAKTSTNRLLYLLDLTVQYSVQKSFLGNIFFIPETKCDNHYGCAQTQ